MSTRTKWFRIFLSLLSGIIIFSCNVAYAEDSLTLYTPYTKISVPPGEWIDYTIDVINNSSKCQNVNISVAGIPKGWNYDLKSGGWNIGQISILPHERKNFSLKVEVPFQIEKGNYYFKVIAEGLSSLPLVINVSQQGTYKTEFTTTQSNMQGNASSTYSFRIDLKNRTAEKQLYSLIANIPPGWIVVFRSKGLQVTSVEIESNSMDNITVELNPPDNIPAGKYEIPVAAVTNSTSANLTLQVVITGSYSIGLTTPTGLLSATLTAGDVKQVELLIKNTGSSNLTDINLSYSAPANWTVTFDPKKVDNLLSGKEFQVLATIKADKKAIPGDYVTNIEAKTSEAAASASFRISVQTPMLWGWVGVIIIIIAVGSVYYLFRKYGRR